MPGPSDETARYPVLLVSDDDETAVAVAGLLGAPKPDQLDQLARPDRPTSSENEVVHQTRTLVEALRLLHALAPSCVLLDYTLADCAGGDAVRSLVLAAPDTPVIALVRHGEHEGVEALGAGAQDFLERDGLRAQDLSRAMRYARERCRAHQAQQLLLEARYTAGEQSRLERGLLPSPVLLGSAVGCATYYRPGRDDAVLGGDFYDVLETPDGKVHAVIGDVMGHGPDEAALGVHLRVAWRMLLLAGVDDAAILPNLALLLAADQDAETRFVTVCDVVLGDGAATIRLAGHPAPVLAGTDVRYLDLAVGPPLGLTLGPAQPEWTANQVALAERDTLVLYTDGLLEAFGGGGGPGASASLGIDELVHAVSAVAGTGLAPGAWVPRLVSAASVEPDDDIAAVVLTGRPSAP